MSLFVLDTLGNQDLLKSETSVKPKFENTKKRKLLNENSGLALSDFTAELQKNEDKNESKQEYDFFGKKYLKPFVF